MHGIADLPEESQAFGNRHPPLVAEAVDGKPLYVLHHKVGQPIVCRSSVEKTRDVRVIEGSQNLALFAKTAEDEIRVHPALDELDGDAATEFAIAALGQIDCAHPAAPDLAHNAVSADLPS